VNPAVLRQSCAVGLSFRPEAREALWPRLGELDVVEIIVDDWISSPAQRGELEEVARLVPAVAHGVGLSIGTATGPDPEYLYHVAEALSALGTSWYSEHLAFTGVPGRDLGQLLPLPRTPEVADIVVRNLQAVRQYVGGPILLENVSYYFDYSVSTLSEVEFIGRVLKRSGCFLLLDLENLYLNASNHGYDARGFIDALAPGQVRGVHVAGGVTMEGLLIDTHDRPVPAPVFDLLAYLLERHAPDTIVLERDQDFDRLDEVFSDVGRLREIVSCCGR
jgi:uncharacterized protein (UPF0276 family)